MTAKKSEKSNALLQNEGITCRNRENTEKEPGKRSK
jgi:hypothetical protein